MNETRKLLEAKFAEMESLKEAQTENLLTEKQAEDDENVSSPKAASDEMSDEEFELIYANLPPRLQEYLTKREQLIEQRFSELSQELENLRWVEDLFKAREERLSKEGCCSPREYFEAAVHLDDEMEKNPQETIRLVAQRYGLDLPKVEENSEVSALQQKLDHLEQRFEALDNFIASSRKNEASRLLKEFLEAKDEKGFPKYRYLPKVLESLKNLLAQGAAPTLEAAYEMAVWADPSLREELIASQAEEMVKARAQEAQKAKKAAFAPKGRQAAAPDYSKMTTRQILEAKMAAYE